MKRTKINHFAILAMSRYDQITIPKECQINFGFLPHTEVEFILQNNQLALVRKRSSETTAIRYLRGRKKTGMTTDELMRLLRDADSFC